MSPPRTRPLVSVDRLKQVLDYNPDTGIFIWKIQLSPKGPVGKVAGTVRPNGYRFITIDGSAFAAQRLAWLYVCGEWPTNLMDHKNRVRDDNRFDNLRDVRHLQNRHNTGTKANSNSKTGVLGAIQRPSGKFFSRISHPGKRAQYLGTFDTAEEAHSAFMAAKAKYHEGAFP